MEQKPPMSAPLLGGMVSWYYSRPINTLAPISSFFFDKPLLQSLDNIKIPPIKQTSYVKERYLSYPFVTHSLVGL